MTPAQCRAARALLKWPVHKLAVEAGMARNTVLTFEGGSPRPISTALTIQKTLEANGIKFSRSNGRIGVSIAEEKP